MAHHCNNDELRLHERTLSARAIQTIMDIPAGLVVSDVYRNVTQRELLIVAVNNRIEVRSYGHQHLAECVFAAANQRGSAVYEEQRQV